MLQQPFRQTPRADPQSAIAARITFCCICSESAAKSRSIVEAQSPCGARDAGVAARFVAGFDVLEYAMRNGQFRGADATGSS
jgi:hypothetical protein